MPVKNSSLTMHANRLGAALKPKLRAHIGNTTGEFWDEKGATIGVVGKCLIRPFISELIPPDCNRNPPEPD
jgi:hypothetical protein